MMNARFARCKADEVGIYAGDRSQRIGRGKFVDLAEVVVPAVPAQGKDRGRPAETLRDVLGSRLDAFEIFDTAETMAEAQAEAARLDTAATVATMTPDTPASPQSAAPTPSRDRSARRPTPVQE